MSKQIGGFRPSLRFFVQSVRWAKVWNTSVHFIKKIKNKKYIEKSKNKKDISKKLNIKNKKDISKKLKK